MNYIIHHPHFEYPQFKQVAHPSIRITALVLHLPHIVAPGGKPVEDSAAVEEGAEGIAAEAAPTTAAEVLAADPAPESPFPSAFFFARAS
jgi:hypothetical protein